MHVVICFGSFVTVAAPLVFKDAVEGMSCFDEGGWSWHFRFQYILRAVRLLLLRRHSNVALRGTSPSVSSLSMALQIPGLCDLAELSHRRFASMLHAPAIAIPYAVLV